MGSDISPLGLSLSLRLNSEHLIYIISGLSLTCRSNSEKLTRFKITADTLMTFARDFFCTGEKHRHTTKLFKVKSGFFLSMVLENMPVILVTQAPHNFR